jgi:hypothetical protein
MYQQAAPCILMHHLHVHKGSWENTNPKLSSMSCILKSQLVNAQRICKISQALILILLRELILSLHKAIDLAIAFW